MAAAAVTPRYKRHRFPAEIISHCVWLYFCLPLSYRQVELVMAQRGIDVTYEAIRLWCRTATWWWYRYEVRGSTRHGPGALAGGKHARRRGMMGTPVPADAG